MRYLSLLFLLSFAGLLQAQNLQLSVEIPRHQVAEYHKPYVSAWIEDANMKVASNLLLWYGVNMAKEEGKEWLKDMRLWWRRVGRSAELPIDGATGATRGPGVYQMDYVQGKAPFDGLADGDYTLVIEAVREVGGRELLKVPFSLPAEKGSRFSAQGEHELGKVELIIN